MDSNKEFINIVPIINIDSSQITIPQNIPINKKEIVKVEDYVLPEIVTQPFYIVHSAWFKDRKQGIIFVEKIDPRSWFYPTQRYHIMQFNNLEELKKEHIKLVGQLDWRLNKNGK